MKEIAENIFLADKPSGISSFRMVGQVKKELNVTKAGHAGTLDPLASGLMIIGVNEGTKKLKEYVGLSKEYVAEILIGTKTTTGDTEGEIIEEVTVADLDEAVVTEKLQGMVGVLRLEVPRYSAMKQGGQPLYKKAREGRDFIVPIRDMEVFEAELQNISCEKGKCVATGRFFVESGVYIRSLAEEFGARLGYPATLQNLRRTKVGEWSVEMAEYIG